jgi:hypothetical protein
MTQTARHGWGTLGSLCPSDYWTVSLMLVVAVMAPLVAVTAMV